MIKKSRKNIKINDEKKVLLSNIFSLSILQASNYILPLLTVPYIVRIIGPEYFGLLAFAMSLIGYLAIITDYSFNLSATRQISIYREDRGKINEIFSAVFITKMILMLISFLLLIIIINCIERFKNNSEIYIYSFGLIVGQALLPNWLFQGLQRMKNITYLNLTFKMIFTISIFIFVKEESDYYIVPLLTSVGYIAIGIVSLYYVKNSLNVKLKWPKSEMIKYQLVEGWHIFISNISISLYTLSNTLILGLMTNNTIVGYFAAAEKVIMAVKGLYIPISQSIYPLIAKKMLENKKEGLEFIYKTAWIVGTLMLAISVIIFINSDNIIQILFGTSYEPAINLLKIMSILPFIITLSNLFGIQTMLNLSYKKEFSIIVGIGAIIGVSLSIILTPIYGVIGLSIIMTLVEVLITIMIISFINFKIKKGIL